MIRRLLSIRIRLVFATMAFGLGFVRLVGLSTRLTVGALRRRRSVRDATPERRRKRRQWSSGATGLAQRETRHTVQQPNSGPNNRPDRTMTDGLVRRRLRSSDHLLLLVVGLVVTLCLFVAHGIDFWQWRFYGIEWADKHISTASAFDQDYYHPVISRTMGVVARYFHVISTPIYHTPILFLIASVLTKLCIFAITSLILFQLVPQWKKAVFLATLVLLSDISGHGVVNNAVWGSPIYFLASISAIFTLLGLKYSIEGRAILSAALFGLSFHLHPLYGVTAFCFIYPASLYMYIREKSHLKALLITVIPAMALVPLAARAIGLGLSDELISLRDWHDFIYVRDPDDMAMWWSLRHGGGSLLLPATVYLIVAPRRVGESRSRAEMFVSAAVVGGLALVVLSVLLEMLHLKGVFFGILSETFIAIQLRRGVWILRVVSLAACFLLYERVMRERTSRLRLGVVLLAVTLTVRWYPLLGILLAGFLIVHVLRERCDYYRCGIALIFVALSLTQTSSSDLAAPGALVIAGVLLTLWLSARAPIWDQRRREALFVAYFIALALIPVYASLGRDHFRQDLMALKAHGYARPLSYRELIGIEAERRASSDARQSAVIADGDDFGRVLQEVRRLNKNGAVVLANPLDTVDIGLLSESPLFFQEVYDRIGINSREYASYYNRRLVALFGVGLREIYADRDFRSRLERLYYDLSVERLRGLAAQGRLKYFVSGREYHELEKMYGSGKYTLYDLAPSI